MISEIRNHIETCIKTCNSKFIAGKKPFAETNEVAGTKIDYTYNVEFGPAGVVTSDIDESVDLVTVSLVLYRQGGKDSNEAFDTGYSDALHIRSLILDNSKYISTNYIKGIRSSEVTPAPVADSQDVYSYNTTFNVTISYGLGD